MVVNLDLSKKTSVKLSSNSYLTAEGIGGILIKSKYRGSSLIEKVIYIPGMKCNMLSIG